MSLNTIRLPLEDSSLDAVGVDQVEPIGLRCQSCGTRWEPTILPGGYLPPAWWRCPQECNRPPGHVENMSNQEFAEQIEEGKPWRLWFFDRLYRTPGHEKVILDFIL